MKHLLILGLLLLLLTTTTWSQDTWVKVIGGSRLETGNSITLTKEGGILITGYTNSNDGDFRGMNKGSSDIFVISLDKDGRVLWKKTMGGSGLQHVTSITITPQDEIYLTGRTESNDGEFERMNKGGKDIFVIKLDKYGEILWKYTFGGSNDDDGQSITLTKEGGTLITGYTTSNDGDFRGMNKGGKDIFVIKLDKDGEILWNMTYGGSKDEVGTSLTTQMDGGIVITGHTSSNDGDFDAMNKGGRDMFCIVLNADGDLLGNKTVGGTKDEHGLSITTTSEDAFIITGGTGSNDGDFKGTNKGDWDVFVTKFDKHGWIEWTKTFGGNLLDCAYSINTTVLGSFAITGYTESNSDDFHHNNHYEDLFVVILNQDGEILQKTIIGGTGRDSGNSLTITTKGEILIVGGTDSNDGDFMGMSKGNSDIFVMKLDSIGNLKPSGKKKKSRNK